MAAPSSGDASAAAGICDNCLTGSILPGAPKGSMSTLAGIAYYHAIPKTKSNDADKKAIVVGVDLFGLGTNNIKIVADRLAELTGLEVFVPDVLEGDAAPIAKLHTIDSPLSKMPFLTRIAEQAKMAASFVAFVGPTFLYKHRMAVVIPIAEKFCNALKAERSFANLGWVGYCHGGTVGVTMATTDTTPISVFVIAHPGPTDADLFAKIKYPVAMICAEEDVWFDKIKKSALASLRALPTASAVYEHEGTTHGFGARPDIRNDATVKAFEAALVQASDWFKAHL